MGRIARRFPVLTLLWAPFAGVPDTGAESLAGVEALLAGRADPWYEALIHLGLGFQTWILTGDADFAREHSEQSLAGFRELGDRWGLITCLNLLADLADQRGDFREGLDLLGQALVLAEELDSALDMADLLTNVAAYSLRAGDFAEAADCYERAAAMARRAGSPESLAMAHAGLADTARLRGDLPAARALAEQALAECPTGWFSSNGIRVGVQTCLGRVALAEGDPERALGCFRAAVTFDPEVLRLTLNYVGLAEAVAGHAVRTGEPRKAAALLGAAQALRGSPLVGPDAEATAGAVRAALGAAEAEAAAAETAGADKSAALALLTSYVTAG
jgi:tetratricopeptide (TPR) repeat protein